LDGAHSLLPIVVLLASAVIAVPLSKRLGLGSILGYLFAGIVVGPAILGLIPDVESMVELSHFGVVMLLFIIGLELKPARLRAMRRPVFGLGSAHVLASGVALTVLAHWAGLGWAPALLVGSALALSSTALVLPLLAERDQLNGLAGRDTFAVLLFQDLAVLPMLAAIPLLGGETPPEGKELLQAIALAAGAILLVFFAGRFLVRPLFRLIDGARIPEVFTAMALLIVVGTAALADAVGLSMSLGAFLAGVILSSSEYRHELQADIEPFKGLLLGLFFMGVGMSVQTAPLLGAPLYVLGITVTILAVKIVAGLLAARLVGGHSLDTALRLAFVLAGGGEFAFVLFGLAASGGILDARTEAILTLAVTLSMLATPLCHMAAERLSARLVRRVEERPFDQMDQADPVIICGFGRVGQIVGRILTSRGIPFTALEPSAAQVDFVRRFGGKVFYGDPGRVDVLRAAGADTAKLMVVALADVEASLRAVDAVRQHFPQLQLFVRARDRFHAHRLMDRGVERITRETLHSSLVLTEQVLIALGLPAEEAARAMATFREHDERTLIVQHAVHENEKALIQSVQQAASELSGLFEADQQSREAATGEPAVPRPVE
jgi:monovalent cation:proton antiporter-2 (CPA2) family protein